MSEELHKVVLALVFIVLLWARSIHQTLHLGKYQQGGVPNPGIPDSWI